MLRRVAGDPIKGESYYRAEIEAGRVGPEQVPPTEFDESSGGVAQQWPRDQLLCRAPGPGQLRELAPERVGVAANGSCPIPHAYRMPNGIRPLCPNERRIVADDEPPVPARGLVCELAPAQAE
jgi:hypothetical protein